jgi:hypothetical protein
MRQAPPAATSATIELANRCDSFQRSFHHTRRRSRNTYVFGKAHDSLDFMRKTARKAPSAEFTAAGGRESLFPAGGNERTYK